MNRGNFKHSLHEILFLTLSAAISGVQDWDEMEEFGKYKIEWLRKFFPYKNGVPSHDTLSRFYARLSPNEFCESFTAWVQTLRKKVDNEVIAVDGKTVNGTNPTAKGMKSLYYVSAYAAENELVLSQELTEEKSNEITAIPKLLDMIECKGSIITVDALNCQTKIAEKVIEKEANYIFALKKNHRALYSQIVDRFDKQSIDSEYTTRDMDHGRIEKRVCSVISNLDLIDGTEKWKGIQTIVKIEATRIQKSTGVQTQEVRYYISSLPADASLINYSVRKHWSIENKLHWMLDVNFGEDKSRKRKDHSATNYSLVIKTALNLIKLKPCKGPFKRQKLRAMLDDSLREQLLTDF